jgi:hypothetical protein
MSRVGGAGRNCRSGWALAHPCRHSRNRSLPRPPWLRRR